ncbi:ribonuclease P protein component [Roseivirga sp. 4D4]|uniref:ribonuclease P protein component n=1 Tax=Roseivirga sp. 4D4 TaxID=1889784 RepID=UPI000B1BD7A1|nr:ribonuclease P protein component [Roseivirga sp. 4D4]
MSELNTANLKYTFPKSERLHSKKLIKELFEKGSSFYLYPYKVIYLPQDDIESNQVLISVSKKKFKKAVTRNLIKRKIKEAYRLNKHLLTDESQALPKLLIGYIYTGKDILPYQTIEGKLKKSLLRLKKESQDLSHKDQS